MNVQMNHPRIFKTLHQVTGTSIGLNEVVHLEFHGRDLLGPRGVLMREYLKNELAPRVDIGNDTTFNRQLKEWYEENPNECPK